MFFNDRFHQLAERAMGGDDVAGAQLRRELEPQMFFMVRQALNPARKVETPLSRTIVAAVRNLDPSVDVQRGSTSEPVLKRLAARLCEQFIQRMCVAAEQRDPRDTAAQVFCTVA